MIQRPLSKVARPLMHEDAEDSTNVRMSHSVQQTKLGIRLNYGHRARPMSRISLRSEKSRPLVCSRCCEMVQMLGAAACRSSVEP